MIILLILKLKSLNFCGIDSSNSNIKILANFSTFLKNLKLADNYRIRNILKMNEFTKYLGFISLKYF